MVQQGKILYRQELEMSLCEVDQSGFTLIVAAMGYGKSTLVSNFLEKSQKPYIYLTFECEEKSPQYLWSMLSRQVAKKHPQVGQKLMTLGFPHNASQFEKIVDILTSEIRTDLVVVFDDYHYCGSSDFDAFINRLIKSQIIGLHMIFVSRTLPKFGVDELLLKGYGKKVNSHLFEMSQEDIKRYFLLQGLELSDQEISKVYRESEGWISAIYLMRQYYSETKRLRTGWHIEKLIDSAVAMRYSSEDLGYLKDICIFDTIHKDQAVAICGTGKVAFSLEKLSESNAFIRYDHNREVFRIHNIFRNYLLKKCHDEPSRLSEADRYKRAGLWCIDTGDILSGLNYLDRANAFDEILNEFIKVHFTKIIDNNPDFIRSIFNRIPRQVLYRNPLAYLGYIGFMVTNINVEVGNHLLTDLENHILNRENQSDLNQVHILGEIELIKAYMEFNKVDKMQARFEKAHKMLGGNSQIANQNKIITFGSPHFLFMYHTEIGSLEKTKMGLEKLFPYYSQMASGCGRGVENLLKAEYFLETLQVESAEREALKAIYRAETLHQVSVMICAQFVRARVAIYKGKIEEALTIVSDLEILTDQQNSPILSSATALVKGYIGGVLSCPEMVANWVKDGDIKNCDVLYQGLNFFYIVYGKYLIMTGDYIKLDAICQDAKVINGILNQQVFNLHFAIFRTIVNYHLNRWYEAEMAIQDMVTIAGPDQLKLIVQEYGKWLGPILSDLTIDEVNRVFFDGLDLNKVLAGQDLECQKKAEVSIETFTMREREVLKHLVLGRTNKQIAESLYLAEVTVRKNITSIYKKLGVRGRTAAVSKIVKLDLF